MSKTYFCDKCGQEFVKSSFKYVNHREYGTVCKLCEYAMARTGGLLTVLFRAMKGE